MKSITKRLKSVLVISMIILPVLLNAQGPGDFPTDVEDNPVPFDGGVSLLVAAGVAYGLKKVHEQRKKGTASFDDTLIK